MFSYITYFIEYRTRNRGCHKKGKYLKDTPLPGGAYTCSIRTQMMYIAKPTYVRDTETVSHFATNQFH